MLAMMLDEPNRFRMTEVPVPEVQPNQLLVKVTCLLSCGAKVSDRRVGRRRPVDALKKFDPEGIH
jgi:threonine dehydrogenase-like Zn-dependent dehydrogenase